jgi:hypothetical protein
MESPGNPNDAIRQQILRYFYDRNAQATSRFGKKGSAVKISDVKRELKAQAGLTQQQVMSNLTYLLDRESGEGDRAAQGGFHPWGHHCPIGRNVLRDFRPGH